MKKVEEHLAKAWYGKGKAWENSHKWDKALSCYDKALHINPKYKDAYVAKGTALYILGHPIKARRAYAKSFDLERKYKNNWFFRGFAFHMLCKYKEAIDAYNKAIKSNPRNIKALINKGTILKLLGRNKEALVTYDKIIKISPKNKIAWSDKGDVLFKLNRLDEALESYGRVNSCLNLYAMAVIYSLRKEKEKALMNLGKSAKLGQSMKMAAKKDKRFKWLWSDKVFKKIIS